MTGDLREFNDSRKRRKILAAQDEYIDYMKLMGKEIAQLWIFPAQKELVALETYRGYTIKIIGVDE